MTIYTQTPWSLEAILTELPGFISRSTVTMVSGTGVVQPGTVVAKITASGKYTTAKATGSDGSQTAVGVTGYKVDATSADATVVIFDFGYEVTGSMLTRDASINSPTLIAAQNAQLAVTGGKVR